MARIAYIDYMGSAAATPFLIGELNKVKGSQ